MKNKSLLGHIMALFTVAVWSTTFISTKVLLLDLSAVEIILYRFTIAYFTLLVLYPKSHKERTYKDELNFVLLGLFGVSLYFLAENFSLGLTTASNVGLLITLAPILTIILAHFMSEHKTLTGKTFIGFGLAIVGVFFVMFNGRFIPSINPAGDTLALVAAACWAVYSNFLNKAIKKFPTIYVARKSFFYGVLSITVMLPFLGEDLLPSNGIHMGLVMNLLFLSVVASALCYILWNDAMKHIGIVKTSNYIYLMPLITMVASWAILGEKINGIMVVGGAFIVAGVYVSQHGDLPMMGRGRKGRGRAA